jgi:hypothetical protein
MPRWNRIWSSVLAGALLGGLAACGGDSSHGPDPVPPTPTPCTQSTLDSDAESIDAKTLIYFDFSVPNNGRLDTTLDWTFTTSQMGFYVVPANTCTLAEFNSRSCTFLVRSEASTVKPKKVSTPNFTAGNYRWIVGNFASVTESYSLQVVLANGSCAALAARPGPVSAGSAGPAPEAARLVRR